ncbi:MAG: 5-(carboxyamino)imidazole ribonucleotide synthase [Bdellovibrionota bacterium]
MRIGILGGGQLARMLVLAGYRLGFSFRILDSQVCSATAELAPCSVGDLSDAAALEAFARQVDVVTSENENIPAQAFQHISQFVPCYPSPEAIRLTQDRLTEKQTFDALNIRTAPWLPIESQLDLERAGSKLGYPLVIKCRRMGYDGRGQWRLRSADQLDAVWREIDGIPCIAEAHVSYARELSIIGVFGRDGSSVIYPLAENVHRNGILDCSLAPAPNQAPDLQAEAERYLRSLAMHLGYVGTLALELFEAEGRLLANECAPRVHNSGHWTIEGAKTSQFENHLRAVAGLPLGSTDPVGLSFMKNIIGSFPPLSSLLSNPQLHIHSYNKEPKPGRKIGHVTAVAKSSAELDIEQVHKLIDSN